MSSQTEVAEPIFLKIGAFLFQVASFEQASEMYCAARDAHGEGASKTPTCKIVTADHREVASISYNGRVWPAGEWKPGARPLCEAAV